MKREILLSALILAGCGGGEAQPPGTFHLSTDESESYDTVFIAVVVADPPGDDLEPGGGEYVILRNRADIRIDVGGWWVSVAGHRLRLGTGRQIEPKADLSVHPAAGDTTEKAVFAGLTDEVLDDRSGRVTLHDSSGAEVARFRYGG